MTTSRRVVSPAVPGGLRPSGWQVRFVVLAAIWGCSFLFIKVGVGAFAPLQVALGRMSIGAVTLVLILALTRQGLPRDPRLWGHLFVTAFFANTLPFTLFAWGETHVSSVVAGIWNATTPLLTVVFAFVMLADERPTRRRLAGLVVGFAGVLVVMSPWSGFETGELLGSLACLGAATSYGIAFPYTWKHLASRSESGLALSAGQLLAGSAQLLVLALLFTTPPASFPLPSVASIGALGALGTGIAYVLNFRIIRDAGASTASTVTYVIPIFSTLAGMLVLAEPLTWNEPLGAAIIIAGVALAQGCIRSLVRRVLTATSTA